MPEFKAGLCGCFSNFSLCLFANCLAPLTVGRVAEYFGDKQPVLWAMASAIPCYGLGAARTQVRERDGIAGSFCGDCCVSLLFPQCVIFQLAAHTGVFDKGVMPSNQTINRVNPDQS